ncbi:hypothetical protein CEXT_774581 [Caerostris extrusa]|uniref:Uncharacterized protein n=1 Tax=Caerostris extrusa TaxID=172846 RepID=A0AAV4UBN6_CAEEX|nr:hypothetical protein CEXT_774581 [Caerostris extrusa]
MQQKINSISTHRMAWFMGEWCGKWSWQDLAAVFSFFSKIQRSLPGSLETSSVGHEFHGLPEIASDVSEVKHIVRSSSQFVRKRHWL